MKRIARSAIVEHGAAEMFALVDDIEAYPRFLPWCVAAKVEERSPTGVRATMTLGMRGLRQSFTTQNDNRPGESIDLRLVKGPFRRFAGAWRFKPLSEAACSIEFSLALFDNIADTMVDAFTRRADAVYGKSQS